MQPTHGTARLAGALYLLLCLAAPFALLYVPGRLFVKGNPAATAANIAASERLFEMGIAVHLVSIIVFIFLAVALYRLLEGVNRSHASLMVILALVSVPIALFSILNELGALVLIRGGDALSVFDEAQVDALAWLLLVLRGKALLIAQIFWGLWLFPFGLLVMRSHFLPRILGVLLIVNGVAYLVQTAASLFFPGAAPLVGRIVFPALLGEIWIMLWLLLRGARPAPSREQLAAGAGA